MKKTIDLYTVVIISCFILTVLVLIGYFNSQNIQLWIVRGGPSELTSQMFVNFTDMFTLASSVIIEAFPFLVLGVLLSTIIQIFISNSFIQKITPSQPILRRITVSLLGIIMPVCECGNIPIGRTLLKRGFSGGDTIAFILSAPILNPVVILTTWLVFSNTPAVFWGRFIAAFIIAHLVAIIISRLFRTQPLLTPSFAAQCKVTHDISHHSSKAGRMRDFSGQFVDELWPLFRLLVVGAFIAGATQVFIPKETLESLGADPLLSILVMILLGFIISICSSVDSFFALAYTQSFTPGAIAAFLIAGPMIDIKMIALLKSTFRVRVIFLICVLVVSFTFVAGWIINRVSAL